MAGTGEGALVIIVLIDEGIIEGVCTENGAGVLHADPSRSSSALGSNLTFTLMSARAAILALLMLSSSEGVEDIKDKVAGSLAGLVIVREPDK